MLSTELSHMRFNRARETFLSMADLADRLAAKLAESGRSSRSVALAIGRNTNVVNDIINRKSRSPRADTLEKLARELNCTVEWLMSGGGESGTPPPSARPAPDAPPIPTRSAMPLDVPVLGTAAGSGDGAIQMEGGAIDHVRRPPALSNARDIYAIYVEGDSMEPKYAPGTLVYCSPHKPARIGDDVVVQVQMGEGQDAPVVAFVKALEKRAGLNWVFRQYNPARADVTYEGRIVGVHRIYTTNELFGV